MSGCRRGPSWRVVSPSGGSILITSAPRSPSCCGAHVPRTTVVQSRMRTPSSGPAYDGLLGLERCGRSAPRRGAVGHGPDTVWVTDLSRIHVEMLPGGRYGGPEGGA